MKFTKSALIVSMSMFLSAGALAEEPATTVVSGTGIVHFQGKVIEGACNLDAENQEQTVDFGQVGKGVLDKDGAANQDFNIKLTGCNPEAEVAGLGLINTVALSFDSASISETNKEELTNSQAAGMATGVAVKVLSKDTNTYLTFDNTDKSKVKKTIVVGDMIYPFTASLVKATGVASVGTGDVQTSTNFHVEYQ